MPPAVRRYGRIVIDPEIQGGCPVVDKTRLTVTAVLACLADCLSIEGVVKRYPFIDKADVVDAIRFGAVLADQSNPQVLGIWDFEVE